MSCQSKQHRAHCTAGRRLSGYVKMYSDSSWDSDDVCVMRRSIFEARDESLAGYFAEFVRLACGIAASKGYILTQKLKNGHGALAICPPFAADASSPQVSPSRALFPPWRCSSRGSSASLVGHAQHDRSPTISPLRLDQPSTDCMMELLLSLTMHLPCHEFVTVSLMRKNVTSGGSF